MPDDHSEVVPLLPIPNRTVKRFSADDSADSRVKVGHCQAIKVKTPSHSIGRFFLVKNYDSGAAKSVDIFARRDPQLIFSSLPNRLTSFLGTFPLITP